MNSTQLYSIVGIRFNTKTKQKKKPQTSIGISVFPPISFVTRSSFQYRLHSTTRLFYLNFKLS